MRPSGILAGLSGACIMLNTRTARLALAASVTVIFSAQPVAAVEIPDPDAVDAVIDGFVEGGYYPFIYVRLEDRDGNVAYEHGAVNRELLPDADINGRTWIRIWSMSKIVTITTVLDLVEDGILSLEDPVVDYIPEFADLRVAVTDDGRNLSEVEREDGASACPYALVPVDTVMTVRHLINHEAGFYYATTDIPCLDAGLNERNVAVAADTDDFIDRLAGLPLVQQPGARYHYGTNTTVLGMVAERAANKSLKQLVEERLTGPLGIEGLRYGLPADAELLPKISGRDGELRVALPGELDIFGADVPGYEPGHPLYLGGEGMLATADGYSDFLRMLLNHGTLNGHRFLETATVEDIYAPHTLLGSPEGHNGFNLWVPGEAMRARGEGEAGIWIGGGYEGTHFWVDPKREFVAVIMSQLFWVPEGGGGRDAAIRAELYRQFWAEEAD